MTSAEAEIIYHAGLDPVVRKLLDMDQRISDLEGQIAKNSRNSSKPPSSDGYKKPAPKSLRKKTTRKTGGQPGHKGSTLKAVDKPDHIKRHHVEACACCGKSLCNEIPSAIAKRQVFDLPPLRLEVTEKREEKARANRENKTPEFARTARYLSRPDLGVHVRF